MLLFAGCLSGEVCLNYPTYLSLLPVFVVFSLASLFVEDVFFASIQVILSASCHVNHCNFALPKGGELRSSYSVI